MLNVFSLINHLQTNPKDFNYIIDQLWIDFYNNVSDESGKIILGEPHNFAWAVNKILKQMDMIVNSTRNPICNLIWANLFSRIRSIGLNYYIFIINKTFLNLEFRYSTVRINIVEAKNEALTFMGLSKNCTKEELLRSYRKLTLKMHPDKGGRAEDFKRLQIYREQIERSFH